MTVEQHNVVDFVTISHSGEAVLTISDHLPWVSVNEHLFSLQEKIKAYLRFVESGEMKQKCPQTTERPVIIEIVMKHAAPDEAAWFFDRISKAIEEAGFAFRIRRLDA